MASTLPYLSQLAVLLVLVASSCGAPEPGPTPTPTTADSTSVPDQSPTEGAEVILSGTDEGLCLTYSWGDALHLDSCQPSTRTECLPAETPSDESFMEMDNADEIVFVAFPSDTCEMMFAEAAREAESMMSGQWGWWVYSSGIEVGDSAFTYGQNVEVRESPDVESLVKQVVEVNATPVLVLEKGERTQVQDMGGSWFRVRIGTLEGWIWGEFVHPDPLSDREYIG